MEDSLFHSLGSCVLHLHIDGKAFPTVFEVTNTPGSIILGRMQAKAMGYVQFPQIIESHAFKTFTATLKKVCTKATHTPETPQDCKSKTMRGTRPDRCNQPKGVRTPDQRGDQPKRVSQARQHKKSNPNRQMNQ